MATSQFSLTGHIQHIHGIEKKYACIQCEFKAHHPSDLKRHVDTVHSEEKQFFCNHCGFQTGHKNNLKVHIESVHEGKRHLCNQCGYQATTEGHLNRHKRSVHNATYHCELCTFQSIKKIDLIKHKYANHEAQKFYCNLCDYQASRKIHLRKHQERIHSEKTYSCELCDFEAKMNTDLKNHIKLIHLGGIKFPCHQCEYQASRKTTLKIHQQRKHPLENLCQSSLEEKKIVDASPSNKSGQDLPHDSHEDLVLNSYLKSFTKVKWTIEEDKALIGLVVGLDGETKVEDVLMVDWERIAENFPGRNVKSIREHWLRVVHSALVEDAEPEAILAYRRRLLEEVSEMGARQRKDINWNKLASIFYPKSISSIVS